jgi:hypothetical protein
MDTAERFNIYEETKNDNHKHNDKHTVCENNIFKTVIN